MIRILTLLVITTCLACNSETTSDSKEVHSESPVMSPKAEGRKAVSADENALISEVTRKPTLLFGQSIEAEPDQIYATLQLVTPAISTQISNAGITITGPITFLYETIPYQNETIKLFIGIPVNRKFKNSGETAFRNINSAVFYKMDCNAEAGATKEYHLKMQRILTDKKLLFETPVLEIMSESRNSDMTVVSKASLLYSKVE